MTIDQFPINNLLSRLPVRLAWVRNIIELKANTSFFVCLTWCTQTIKTLLFNQTDSVLNEIKIFATKIDLPPGQLVRYELFYRVLRPIMPLLFISKHVKRLLLNFTLRRLSTPMTFRYSACIILLRTQYYRRNNWFSISVPYYRSEAWQNIPNSI